MGVLCFGKEYTGTERNTLHRYRKAGYERQRESEVHREEIRISADITAMAYFGL